MKSGSFWALLTLAVLLFLGGVASGSVILTRIQSAGSSLEASWAERARLEERIANAKRIRSFLESSRGKIAAVERIFVSESEIVSFIEELEASARESNIALAVATASLPLEGGGGPAFELRTTGEFQNLFQFLLLLENFPHILALEKVNFVKTSPWDMRVIIRIISYEA